MRLSIAVLGVAVVACRERTPPPGAGALETTPTASTASGPASALLSMPRAEAYPNGSVITTDPKSCHVTLLRDGAVQWDREISGCGGLLESTVAMDSMLYVRDSKSLSSFDPEGNLRWTVRLSDTSPSHTLAAPAALADSRVVLAATPKSVVVYERDGKISWSFSPPSEEMLVTAPVEMKTEGVLLMTSRAAYYLSATGEVRWRVPSQH